VTGTHEVERVHRRVAHVMGLPVSLALRGRHLGGPVVDHAWDHVLSSLRVDEAMFSTYRSDSLISRLDRGEISLTDCPRPVHEVLALAERARCESGGAFDVRRFGPDGRSHLDPSGVVKGWALDRAVSCLLDLHETDVCISAGGDMVCRTRPSAPAWRIGVEDPADPSLLVAVLPLHTGALATSGNIHRGEHIQDARTGRPAGGVASVTVVAADLTTADIDATAAYALGTQAAAWLRSRGRTGLVVHRDGSLETLGGYTADSHQTQTRRSPEGDDRA
jgi:thiamine biosynthesis lipoprotein